MNFDMIDKIQSYIDAEFEECDYCKYSDECKDYSSGNFCEKWEYFDS